LHGARRSPLKPWLPGAKAGWGVDENDPKFKRIVEILKKKEKGDISIPEHKEFPLLNSELVGAYESIHGKRVHPTGELVTGDKPFNREEEIAAIDYLFRRNRR
jgi:hypothetical protein